jgi:3-hydroxybutyrate dehydrogenase
MIDETRRLHGRLDVLVLNAGLQHKSPIEGFPDDEWDALHNVMLKGPFQAMRTAWPALRASRGNVVVISSTSAVAAEPNKAAYVSAKAGVAGLVRAAALDGAPDGIRVNAVAPGWMRTPMAEAQVTELARDRGISETEAMRVLLDRQPLGRFVELSEVTEAVMFLAGERASAITGILLPVDCGLLAA